ncbi:MAG: SRPBCC family protein, partial [Actinomycetota bacterium]
AAREATWARWTDVAAWPAWNPMCAEAILHGPLAEGAQLELNLVHPRGKGRTFWTRPRVVEVAAPERVAWEAVGPGLTIRTETTLAEEPDGTLLTLTSATTGRFAISMKLMALGDRTLARMYAAMLNALVADMGRVA